MSNSELSQFVGDVEDACTTTGEGIDFHDEVNWSKVEAMLLERQEGQMYATMQRDARLMCQNCGHLDAYEDAELQADGQWYHKEDGGNELVACHAGPIHDAIKELKWDVDA